MRELTVDMIRIARRAGGTQGSGDASPTERLTRSTLEANDAADRASLGAQAVRLARLAAVMHMDQAATLRARLASDTVLPSGRAAKPLAAGVEDSS